jgi:tRNA threonylcarbamoyladenosine biosynthesis protein TsaE
MEIATPDAMEALGRRLGGLLQPGDIVLLNGSLGAGKTLLVSGVAQALGVEVQVTSPTFLVVRSYEGLLPLTHADVYRLSSTAEFTDLELVEAAEDGVLMIEWGDAVRSALPEDVLSIEITATVDGPRLVAIDGEGEWEHRPLAELKP